MKIDRLDIVGSRVIVHEAVHDDMRYLSSLFAISTESMKLIQFHLEGFPDGEAMSMEVRDISGDDYIAIDQSDRSRGIHIRDMGDAKVVRVVLAISAVITKSSNFEDVEELTIELSDGERLSLISGSEPPYVDLMMIRERPLNRNMA